MRYFRLFRKTLRCLLLLSVSAGISPLGAVVGDWASYGSLMNWKHFEPYKSGFLAATDGGLIYRKDSGDISVITNTDGLDHIVISALYVDPSERIWTASKASPAVISTGTPETGFEQFDFNFTEVRSFAGDSINTFAVYKQDNTPGIAHFINNEGRIVFRDFYDQFPAGIISINDVCLHSDTLYIGTNIGLYCADIRKPNLKPAASWDPIVTDANVVSIRNAGEQIYFNFGNDLYCYDGTTIVNEGISVGEVRPFRIHDDENDRYLSNGPRMWVSHDHRSWTFYRGFPSGAINDFIWRGDTLVVGLAFLGIESIDRSGTVLTKFIPNSPLQGPYYTMAYSAEQGLIMASTQGLSILSTDGSWHNIVRSDTTISVGNPRRSSMFSADTIAFTYFGGTMFDCLVTENNLLYLTYSGVHTDYTLRYPINYEPIAKPGPLLELDLNNYRNYMIYDTTNGCFDGSEASVAGVDEYIIARGMAETDDGSVWVINAHASDLHPLLRIYPDGTTHKYSIEESGNALQVLPVEMTTDNYNRLWIANQYHPDNAPVTSGGITIYDLNRKQWFSVDSRHGLANQDVSSIDRDPGDGSIWITTPGGVQNIIPPSMLNSANFDDKLKAAVQAPVEGLSDITVTRVRVDPRSNKWMLSSDGGIRVLLANGTWYNGGIGFTRGNSPLLSDAVIEVVFDSRDARAYILSDAGLNVLETGWGSAITRVEDIIVYPQPFDRNSDDILYFDNLPDQSEIIISSLQGRVLAKIPLDYAGNYGRQISWNMSESLAGNKLAPGVYYALVYNVDGLKRTLKFAVK